MIHPALHAETVLRHRDFFVTNVERMPQTVHPGNPLRGSLSLQEIMQRRALNPLAKAL